MSEAADAEEVVLAELDVGVTLASVVVPALNSLEQNPSRSLAVLAKPGSIVASCEAQPAMRSSNNDGPHESVPRLLPQRQEARVAGARLSKPGV
jgi:hypothetical protein